MFVLWYFFLKKENKYGTIVTEEILTKLSFSHWPKSQKCYMSIESVENERIRLYNA